MNRKHKTPTSVYATIAAGFALGALATASVLNGHGVDRALAGPTITAATPRLAGATSVASTAEMKNLNDSFAALAEFASPAVVEIRGETGRRQGPNGAMEPMMAGSGSGFIYRSDGYIVTNDHVVGPFDKVTVVMQDGREYEGKVTRGGQFDIAIVKIEATNLPTLAFADSKAVRPGQFAMALGSPFGLENTVTVGHVSAVHRSERQLEGKIYPDLIQTDTAINRGNSGGPLINVDGQVIGVNTMIFSPSGTSAGLGFAITANQAKMLSDTLIEKGKITRAYLGLATETLKPYRREELKLEGGAVVNREVDPSSPAGKSGIKKDDIVTRVNGQTISSSVDLRDQMMKAAPGTTAEIEYLRGTERRTAKVKLGDVPAEEQAPTRRFGGGQNPFGQGESPFPREFFSPREGNPFGDMAPRTSPPADGKPRLGVRVGDASEEVRRELGIPAGVAGAVVASVEPGSLAASVGMRPGDVIVQFGDKAIKNGDDVVQAVGAVKKGQTQRVKFLRFSGNNRSEINATVTF